MDAKTQSLIKKLRMIAVLPLLCLGIVVIIISSYVIYNSVKAETKDGLNNLIHAFYSLCDQSSEGDYAMDNGQLTKGGKPFDPDCTIIDRIHTTSGVDATLFWGDTRALTTIRHPNGSRATGTQANEAVTKAVLMEGTDYFSNKVMVNDEPYFGYYMPLKNGDESIVGMLFVGKPRYVVIGNIRNSVLMIFAVTLFFIICSSIFILWYAQKIVQALKETKEFLGSIVQRKSESEIAPQIIQRNDEIGEMARFSVELKKSITTLVDTDALTGLYNRRAATIYLEDILKEYCNHDSIGFSLAIGDIDGFKQINDHYGHLAGDAVLINLAPRFISHMKGKGFVARWGGEEFLFIYEQTTPEHTVMYLEELQETIRSTSITYKGIDISVTMTFGIATPKKNTTLQKLLKSADENLYIGKTSGKNCVILSTLA